MSRPTLGVAAIIDRFGKSFIDNCHPNAYQLSVLGAISMCRTPAMGGHRYRCNRCGRVHTSYNSCRNRHCPQCQGARQAFWVEDRVNNAYPVKHYHMVFTLPEVLNSICLTDSRRFYNLLFSCVWDTLQSFGYSHYGVQGGAVCILHTWGQNLCLHPHVHCIVPALGYSLKGKMIHIGKNGKYLFPVSQLSLRFRSLFLSGLKKYLVSKELLHLHKTSIEKAWQKPWVVFCEPSFGSPQRVINYLGQYTHRVAISNRRIINVGNTHVSFSLKDYRDSGSIKTLSLTGVEFLRRFCLHILPKGFVKIRHYGIYSTRFRSTIPDEKDKMVIKPEESTVDRTNRLLGIDTGKCPFCKKGRLIVVEIVPRTRSPGFVSMAVTKYRRS